MKKVILTMKIMQIIKKKLIKNKKKVLNKEFKQDHIKNKLQMIKRKKNFYKFNK